MIDSETKAKLEQLSDSKDNEKDRYWSRPFLIRENDIIIQEEKKSKKLRTEGKLWARDLTKDLVNEAKEAYEHNLNTIILLTGLPGLGKTEAGMALAVFCRDISKKHFPKARIWWNFGFQETVTNSDLYQEGDVIEQDEEQRAQGMDSTSVIKAISDLQEIAFRENRNIYIVSSASARLVKGVAHVILEAIGGNYHRRISLLKVYSAASGLPLGHVKVPLLDQDNQDWLDHLKREKEFKARIRGSKGYTSTKVDPVRFNKDIEKLIKKIFGKYPIVYEDLSAYQKRMMKRFRVDRLKSKLLDAEIAGSEQYQKRVMMKAWDLTGDFKDLYKDELELEKIKLKEEQKQQKQQEQDNYLEEVQKQKIEDTEEIVSECADFYVFKKVKPVQLKVFFLDRGIFKENIDYCMARTYDIMSELEDNFSRANRNDRQAVSGDFLFNLIKRVEDLSFYSDLEQSVELTLNRVKTKKFKQKHLEAWIQYYRDHVSVDHLTEQYRLKSKSSFTNSYAQGGWFSIVKEELLGHVVEEALTLNYYPGYQVIGGKTEPDLIKDNTMIEVKARSRREPPNVKMLNQKEIDHLTNQGELQLCLVSFKPGKCMIEFFTVQKKESE